MNRYEFRRALSEEVVVLSDGAKRMTLFPSVRAFTCALAAIPRARAISTRRKPAMRVKDE